MLIILISWLIQYTILRAAGNFILKPFTTFQRTWFDELIIGYCFLSVVAVTLSLFIPINIWTQCTLLIISVILLFRQFKSTNFRLLKFGTGEALILLFTLILAVPVPNHGDSSFYHGQALKWIENYSVIPGLGNFFGRLAFNSSFFNTQAIFSFYPVSDISSRFLNSFLILIWFLHLYKNAAEKTNSVQIRLVSLVFACVSLFVTRGWVSSVAPDVTTGLFMLIITYKLILVLIYHKPIPFPYFIVLIFTAVTIKLPAIFLLPLLVFYPGILGEVKLKYLLIPAIILIPWCARNIILSGFLVYPYCPLFAWKPDWLVPPEVAFIERQWISSWARMPGQPWQYVLSLSPAQWLPIWLKNQYVFNKIIVLLFSMTFIYTLFILLKDLYKQTKILSFSRLICVWGGLIIVWFLTAPDFRFGYGLILPYFIFAYFYYGKNYLHHGEFFIKLGKIAFPGLLGILVIYITVKEKTQLQQLIVKPQPYPVIPLIEHQIGNIRVNIPFNDENCWNSNLPCVNNDLFPIDIEPRGTSLKDGFRPVSKKQASPANSF